MKKIVQQWKNFMENKKVYIFGSGGHGKVVAELALNAQYYIEVLIDDNPKTNNFGLIQIINSKSLKKPNPNIAMIIAIGNNLIRRKISLRYSNLDFLSIIHNTAFVSPSANIGDGTVIMLNAVVNSNAKIGNHVIINTAAIIEHDCNLEDFVHVSPSATLSGNVCVGTGTLIGTGAIVIPNIKIGNWCTIGAGAVIIDDVPDGATVIGNPAKIIKYNYYSELDSI